MAQFKFTENQLSEVKKRILKEGLSNNEYTVECNVEFYQPNLTYKGMEIDDIRMEGTLYLKYYIDIDYRSWGIKDVSMFGYEGDSEIDIVVSCYDPDSDDFNTKDFEMTLPLNWDNVEVETNDGSGMITVGRDVTVNLEIGDDGELVAKNIELTVYNL